MCHVDCSDLTLATELSVSENITSQCARCAVFKNKHQSQIYLVSVTRINYLTRHKKAVQINAVEHQIFSSVNHKVRRILKIEKYKYM